MMTFAIRKEGQLRAGNGVPKRIEETQLNVTDGRCDSHRGEFWTRDSA